MAPKNGGCSDQLTEYWDAQLEGYEQLLKKPVWRDFLQTQKEKMDKIFLHFWEEGN